MHHERGVIGLKICSFLELSGKDVINLCSGEKLGRICDMEINIHDCTVVSIVLPGQGNLLGFGKSTECVIPWKKVECVGEDTILVRLEAEEQSCCCIPKRKLKRNLFGK